MAKLRLARIYKSFDSTQALKDVSFSTERGAVLALCGENGAGKSTLIKILSGAVQPDRGEILLNDNPVHIETPRRAIGLGIHTVHQELSLLPHLSVAENLLLGRMPHKGPAWRIDWKATRTVAQAALADLGFENVDVEARTDSLAVSIQQIVEISKALIDTPEILILDEPTAVLSARETDILFGKIRDLAKRGTTVIYISHRIEEIFDISDHVFVLKDGAGVLSAETKTLDRDSLVRAMVGRSLAAIYPVRNSQAGEPVLECRNLGKSQTFRDISFEVRAGEIVGMFGLVGSGRTDVAKALFGAAPLHYRRDSHRRCGGRHSNAARRSQPWNCARHRGPQARRARRSISTAIDNGGLASMDAVSRSGMLDRRAQRQIVGAKLDDLAVRPRDLSAHERDSFQRRQSAEGRARQMAAGARHVRLFIFDEPTRGVDIATKVEIYSMMAELADAGMAVLLISSEMPEILGMSDRVLVMRGGRIVAELDRAAFSMETVFAHAAGVAPDPASAPRTAMAGDPPQRIRACCRDSIPTNVGLRRCHRRAGARLRAPQRMFSSPSATSSACRASSSPTVFSASACCWSSSPAASISRSARCSPLPGCWQPDLQAHMPFPMAIAMWRLAMGIAVGSSTAILIARFALQPFIVTLATMGSLRGLLYIYSETPQYPDDPLFRSLLGGGFIGPLPVPTLLFVLALPIVWFYLNHTISGRAVYAIGVNQRGGAARRHRCSRRTSDGRLCRLGLSRRTRRRAAGLARSAIAQPSVGVGYELDAIAAVVIGGGILGGGGGTVPGVLGGVLALAVVDNVLNLFNVESYYQQFLKGLIILVAVLARRKRN